MQISHKTVTVSDNEAIHIFDNLFTYVEKERFFKFITSSLYRFGGGDVDYSFKIKNNAKTYLQSYFSNEDIDKFGILSSTNSNAFLEVVKGHHVKRGYVYVSDHTIVHNYHSDPGSLTFLYYPNLTWDSSFGGETMFANEDLSEIVYASMYVPGRLLIYNSSILHKMSAPSSSCPFHRFSFVLNWNKNETHNGEIFPIQTN